MPRINTHVKETKSRDYIRSRIDSCSPEGNTLIREWSERDYGIDFIMEMFEDGYPTGKIAFLQIKGTEKVIAKMKTKDCVSCPNVSISSLGYAYQKRIPFVLIYVSLIEPKGFFYVDLQSVVENIAAGVQDDQKTVTVHIPNNNYIGEDMSPLLALVESYYQ